MIISNWEADQQAIFSRVSFELSCPKESLTLNVLAIDIENYSASQKSVYVRPYHGSWIMNSNSDASPAKH